MPDVLGASNPVAAAVRDAAQRLLGELAGQGTASPVDAVTARELSAAAATAMQAAVDRS